MEQSAFSKTPTHVAVIMDGNGRWATARGRPRSAGHVAGARAVRRIVEAAPALGIRVLTLYAFSADNWRRPPAEVVALMRLFRKYLHGEAEACVRNGVRLSVIGRRDRIPAGLRGAIESVELLTATGRTLDLRIAMDYSARDAIVQAAAAMGATPPSRDRFARSLAASVRAPDARPVDLLIRTGGEQRLSDFLLWEAAYAELYFTPRLWPDFDAPDLREALAAYAGRDRRFGALDMAVAG